jgi:hypothetical protein
MASSSLGAHNHHKLIQTASSSSQPVMYNSHANQHDPISSEGIHSFSDLCYIIAVLSFEMLITKFHQLNKGPFVEAIFCF